MSAAHVPLPLFILVAVVLIAGIALQVQQRVHLMDEVRAACSETSAAAKLDLSTFVPLCEQVK